MKSHQPTLSSTRAMNASEARKRSLRNLEPILWEQVYEDVREKVEMAVEGEEQHTSVPISSIPKGERGRTMSNLQILGFHVRMDGGNDRGHEYPAKNIIISW